ncbi:MAG TPA: hypothetical protein DGR97_12415 [Gammaproteobacteria bacterium]|nr:hypothetical protein [Gammaproteobacteria bacterium]|tara:strand:- start:330 stop:1346 length:1017 start_codon:yes stop_codon:yes gene_type:complete
MSQFTKFIQREVELANANGQVTNYVAAEQEFEFALTAGTKCPLSSLGLVSFTGPDAHEFVNAQFTTDCTEITPKRSQFSAWCDPKGRALYLFTLCTDGEKILAILPKQQIANYMRRLKIYIMRSNVYLEDVSDTYSIFGITLDTVVENIKAAPNDLWATLRPSPDTIEIRHGSGHPRCMVIGDDKSAIERWGAISLPVISENTWTALECIGGMPHLDEKSSGKYLPQNLNLDRLDALSFSKGCYPGQEIIARLKYRGEIKKRLMVASYDSGSAPNEKYSICTRNSDRKVGRVLYARRVSQTKSIVSAIVELNAWNEDLILGNKNTRQLNRIELPYSFD